MKEIEISVEELEEITLEDTREVVTVDKPVTPELEDITIKPTTEEQNFKSNKYGYDNVTVEAIQDENLIPENIKSGTEILGVKGNFTGGKYKPRYLYNKQLFRNYRGTELEHETQMLDTTNFTDMNYMFGSCSNLTHLDLSGWNTSNVINMSNMFRGLGCSELVLSSFDTSNVTDMSYMFRENKNLTHLDLSNFDTSNVTDMNNMFYGSAMLTKLDIRNFTFDKVTNYNSMFLNIPSNCLIIVKGETEKAWVLARRSSLTNVKTIEELEG